jgi:hypothetical protein
MIDTLLTDAPYKGLMPYAKEDAPFFFGRKNERELIIANLTASRLTLLYGPSGVGKSSVIDAGVVNELQKQARLNVTERGTPESVVVVFRSWRDDPVAGLRNQIAAAVQQIMPGKECDQLASGTLTEHLRSWTECIDGELLIILDQFEEYFLYHAQEGAEGTFAVELPRAINRPDLRVNFLISIREDALAKLDFFKGRIPSLFDSYLRIEHLSRKSARDAIEQPIQKYNSLRTAEQKQVAIEPELVDAVLEQVKVGQVLWSGSGQGAVENKDDSSRIETPYLQLVMTRLWDEEKLVGSPTLRLQTLQHLGGAASIVRTHLDKTMSALAPAEQDTAAQMFRYLVTPSGSKIALTVSDLLSYTELPETQINPVLHKLSERVRILRTVNPLSGSETAPRYEIFHDVLATSMLDWQARHTQLRELSATRKSLLGLILPCFLGVVADTLLCFGPAGAIVVWLMLRRKKLGLNKKLVNSVAIGWGVGWTISILAIVIVLVISSATLVSVESAHPIYIGIFYIVYFGIRLFGPAGATLTFLLWRRRALAKLKLKPALAASPTLS